MTAILPRRSFSPLLGRLLHDRTADKIAGVVSRVPNAAATIIPFDVQNRLHVLQERQAVRDGKAPVSLTPVPSPPGVTPIGSIQQPGKATVEGRVRVVEIRSVERNSVLACEICDSTGDLTALFYGRSRIAGLMCGSRVRFRGQVGIKGGAPVMVNPAYELIVPHVAGGSGQNN